MSGRSPGWAAPARHDIATHAAATPRAQRGSLWGREALGRFQLRQEQARRALLASSSLPRSEIDVASASQAAVGHRVTTWLERRGAG